MSCEISELNQNYFSKLQKAGLMFIVVLPPRAKNICAFVSDLIPLQSKLNRFARRMFTSGEYVSIA